MTEKTPFRSVASLYDQTGGDIPLDAVDAVFTLHDDADGNEVELAVGVPFGAIATELRVAVPRNVILEVARLLTAPTIEAGERMIRTDRGTLVTVIEAHGVNAAVVSDRFGQTRVSPRHLTRPRTMRNGTAS